MANGGFGQGPKKETVYGGTAPTAQGTVYGGPPGGGTVYNGGSTGTVYRPASQSAGSRTPAVGPGAMASRLFFTIAGLSVLNTVLALANAPIAMALGLGITRVFDTLVRHGGAAAPMMIINFVVVGVFGLIGFFARQGSRGAILIGIILYALDTAALLLLTPLLIVSLLLHGFFLLALVGAYRTARS